MTPETTTAGSEPTHHKARTWADRELAGTLAPRLRPRLHDHLRACEGCRAHYDRGTRALRAIAAREGRMPAFVLPELELVGSWLLPEPFGIRAALFARPRARWLIVLALAIASLLLLVRPRDQGRDQSLTQVAPDAPIDEPARRAPSPARPSLRPEVPDLTGAIELRAWAFDAGATGWVAGEVSDAPPGGGRALKGIRYNPKTASLGVIYRPVDAPALTVTDDTWIVFRAWLGEEPSHRPYVEVAIAIPGGPDFVWRLGDTDQARWQTIAVRLADLRPYDKQRQAPPPVGAAATELKLRTNTHTGDTFFVDDVRILRLPGR